jgi:hypothetical protein
VSIFTKADQAQGATTLALQQFWPDWVHRRVDHLKFDNLTTVAVRASLDFTVPDYARATAINPAGPPIVFVPVSLFLKSRVTALRLCGEAGEELPLLTRPRVGLVGAAMLWVQAQLVRTEVPADITPPEIIPERVERAFRTIAAGSLQEALVAHAWLVEDDGIGDECMNCRSWRRALRHSARFKSLSRKLASSYMLITPMLVQDTQRRRVLELSYETRRLLGGARSGPFLDSPDGSFVKGLRARLRQLGTMSSLYPYPIYFRTGVVGRSRCYHQQADVPPGLQLTAGRLGIYDSRDNTRQGAPDVLFGKLQRAQLHVAHAPADTYGVTQLLVRARISNIARTAWLASGLSAAMLVGAATLAIVIPSSLTSLVALLLVPPAALSAYIARSTEPLVSSEVLFGLRLIAAVSAGVVLLAAGAAAVGKRCTTINAPVGKANTVVCTTRPGALAVLIVLVVLAILTFGLLEAIRHNINRPPEHRYFRALQQFYEA